MENTSYVGKQVQIAQCMHELLCCSLDLKTGEPCYCAETQRDALNRKLQQICADLRAEVIAEKGYCGAYWWNVPWGDVQDVIEQSLEEEVQYDGWRFETKRFTENDKNRKILCVQEDGICSQFESHRELDYVKRSNYAQSEIEDRLESFNRKIDNYEDYQRYTVEGRVYSESSEKVYESMNDYLFSSEHQLLRYRANELLKNSMYRTVETKTQTVISRSIRYGAFYTYGNYSVDGAGNLNELTVRTFSNVESWGNGTEYAGQSLLDRTERVLCAAEIGSDPDVLAVPVEVLDAVVAEERADFWEAVRDAAMLACLGNKLTGERVELPTHQFRDQAHFDRIVAIDQKVRQRQDVSSAELSVVLDALNKGLFAMEPLALLEDKAMYMLCLSQSGEDDETQLYWLDLCLDLSYKPGLRHKSQRLLEYAITASAIMAEVRLKGKLKEEAEQYSLIALECCRLLRTVEPASQMLGMEPMCQKFLKKARKKGLFF